MEASMTHDARLPKGGFIDKIQFGESIDGSTRVNFRASLSFPMDGELADTVLIVSSHTWVPSDETLPEVNKAILRHLADFLRSAGGSGLEEIEQALRASAERMASQ